MPFIRMLCRNFPAMSRLLFVIDQEEDKPAEIYEKISNKLSEHGFTVVSGRGSGRWRLYDCTLGAKRLWICVVVNGLDAISCAKHTIEDHFLEAAKSVLGGLPAKVSRALESADCDPKEAWKALGKEGRMRVLRELARNKELAKGVFPQHVSALAEEASRTPN